MVYAHNRIVLGHEKRTKYSWMNLENIRMGGRSLPNSIFCKVTYCIIPFVGNIRIRIQYWLSELGEGKWDVTTKA